MKKWSAWLKVGLLAFALVVAQYPGTVRLLGIIGPFDTLPQ